MLCFTTLHRYGTRLVADSMLEHEYDSDGEDNMWLSDDNPEHQDWQQQGSHQQQLQLQQEQQQAAGQDFLRQLATATTAQQQQQQEGTRQPASLPASAASSDGAAAAGAYFDDSYFGLPADASAAPQDLQVSAWSALCVSRWRCRGWECRVGAEA